MIPPMDVRCPCCTYRIRIEFENPTVILKVRSAIPGPPDDAPPSLVAEAQASIYPCCFRETPTSQPRWSPWQAEPPEKMPPDEVEE